MKSSVVIKGNKFGFQIVLNPDLDFEVLLSEVEKKFQASSGFFDPDRPVAVSFTGRDLSEDETDILVDRIHEKSNLRICYVIDGAQAEETRFARALSGMELFQNGFLDPSGLAPGRKKDGTPKDRLRPEPSRRETEVPEVPEESGDPKTEDAGTDQPVPPVRGEGPVFPEDEVGKHGQFYRGILRSGQKIEVDGSFVILGDVNPGAQIIAGGNVVVLGSLKGTVYAGYPADREAIVAALNMEPMQIQIGDLIARSADSGGKRDRKLLKKKKQQEMDARMAFVEGQNICIEKIDRSLINEISSR